MSEVFATVGRMKVTFDRDFDGGAWPGPLAGRDAALGEAWVGEAGFLGILEKALGATAPSESALVRAAALVPGVERIPGFWRGSAEVDPLGTARRLLEWRDLLRLHGWNGEPLTERLAALSEVTREVLPGVSDRLETIAILLSSRSAEVETVELFEARGDLPYRWRMVFDALERWGTAIIERTIEPAAAGGDLAAARLDSFVPAGDGTLQLVRPQGPLAAAEAVAAWLAERPELESTVIVGGDAILDDALARYGLPTTGASGGQSDNALLQVLPLVLALGWDPPDPQRALELLTLPRGPIRKQVAHGLVRALHERPAVGSDAWNAALAAGLAKIEDPDGRTRAEARIEGIFRPAGTRGGGYGVEEAVRRIELVQSWLHGAMTREEEARRSPWEAAVAQCASLLRLIQLSRVRWFSPALLQRFVEEASASVRPSPRHEAQAGLAHVARPGALAGPARRVIWWNFERGTAARPVRLPLSSDEQQALLAAGVELPDPAREAVRIAERMRRPLLAPSDALLLICPSVGADGEEQHPHPLWDEIAVVAGKTASRMIVARPIGAGDRSRRDLLPVLGPRLAWKAPAGAIGPRALESPSSMGLLIGCSLAWALRYVGGLHGGASAALPAAERMIGTAVHEILAELLAGPERTPEEAGVDAIRLFDEKGPLLAAPLYLPGADAARAQARRATSAAATQLYRLMREDGLRVVSVEKAYRREALGTELEGRPDLVLAGRDGKAFPVDLKWSGASYRRKSIAAGSAYQLAAYSFLVDADGKLPLGAFFILQQQRLLACGSIGDAQAVNGPSLAETWEAAVAAHGARMREVGEGRVSAPGNPDENGEVRPKEDAIEDGALRLKAPCAMCEFTALCGLQAGNAKRGGK